MVDGSPQKLVEATPPDAPKEGSSDPLGTQPTTLRDYSSLPLLRLPK